MGHVTDALSDTVSASESAPKLLLAVFLSFVLGGLAALVFLVISIVPLVGQLVGTFGIQAIVLPLVLAGLLTMADSALDGGTKLGDYVTGLKENASPIIGAYAIRFCIRIALTVVVALLLVALTLVGGGVLGALTESLGSSGGTGASALLALLAGAGSVGLLLLPLVVFSPYLIAGYFFQFVDVAVVVGDEDATDAFRKSIELVREDPLSSLGYYAVRLVLVFVSFTLPWMVGNRLGLLVSSGIGTSLLFSLAGGAIGFLVFAPLGTAVVVTYHAAYFRRRTGRVAN
ncbi:MAG: hypothetical protein ABEI99_00825 [Halobaculum sp.]